MMTLRVMEQNQQMGMTACLAVGARGVEETHVSYRTNVLMQNCRLVGVEREIMALIAVKQDNW